MGYVEQSNIHTPALTVVESLTFSAHLRLDRNVNKRTENQLVDNVSPSVHDAWLLCTASALVGKSHCSDSRHLSRAWVQPRRCQWHHETAYQLCGCSSGGLMQQQSAEQAFGASHLAYTQGTSCCEKPASCPERQDCLPKDVQPSSKASLSGSLDWASHLLLVLVNMHSVRYRSSVGPGRQAWLMRGHRAYQRRMSPPAGSEPN